MRYSLFLSDFDGTLVRADGTVSEENKRAIARYTQAGGVFAIVTGRMTSSILPRVKELGIHEGLVAAYQGAVIADLGTGRLMKDEHFPKGGAARVVRLLEREGHHIHVYTPEGLIANRRDALLEEYERVCGVRGIIRQEPLSDWLDAEDPPVYKVLAMLEPDRKRALQARLMRELGEGYTVTCSAEWLVEVIPAGVSKGEAVRFLSEYYRIGREKIAAIGDQLNDLPLLEAAGGKFTVENGEPELKKIARVVPSNEEDGVAAALSVAMEEV